LLHLNSVNLRDMLGDIFFGESKTAKLKYIVPMQGNWWTPSEKDNEKVATWIGYSIVNVTPWIRARYIRNEEDEQLLISTCKATVHLQIIGKDAEAIAYSLIHWDERTDVQKAFSRFAGQLFYDKRKVITTLYYQDGQNSTLSYNVDFNFFYADFPDATKQQEVLTGAEVNGVLYF